MRVYKFADIPVGIENRGEYLEHACKDYLIENETPEFTISVTDKDLEYEQSRSEELFSKPYLEYIAIYRAFCEKAIDYNVVLMHGSVLEIGGHAYMFSAPSGTGKSTHARMWREHFGDRVTMINDDKPLLRFDGNDVYVYGTPWDGKHKLSSNKKAKLAGICFLSRGNENIINRINPDKALEQLVNQIYRPRDAAGLMKTLDYVDLLGKNVPLYEMKCNISEEAAAVAYEAMKKAQ